MGRHSDGKSNYRLSGGAILVILVALAVILSAILMMKLKPEQSDDASEARCVSGELSLPVASTERSVGEAIVAAYNESHRVVRDYCMQAELVDKVEDAAILLAPETANPDAVLRNAKRSAAVPDPQIVYAAPLGVEGQTSTDPATLKLESVRFVLPERSDASVAVASLLAKDEAGAVDVLQQQAVEDIESIQDEQSLYAAAIEQASGDRVFTSLDAVLNYVGIPLNSTDNVDENKSRAGQDLMKYAASTLKTDSKSQVVDVPDQVWSQVAEIPVDETEKEQKEVGSENRQQALDTLFLYDTSDAMQPFKSAVDTAIRDAAYRVTESGHQVALWNYSSPLNPGVTKGWRSNIAMTSDAEDVAYTASLLGTGGAPQTREALFAAADAMRELDRDIRIVLITTGTADDDGSPQAAAALQDRLGERIKLDVVRVGDSPADTAVTDVASVVKEAPSAEQVSAALTAVVD